MPSKYTLELLTDAVAHSTSFAGVLKHLGIKQAGGSQAHITRRIRAFGIDTSHFVRFPNTGKPALARKTAIDILVILPEGSPRPKLDQLRRALAESGVEIKCACGLTDEWQGDRLVLEIDHINGDWLDNRLENLRYICPNCHSQTPTSRSWRR